MSIKTKKIIAWSLATIISLASFASSAWASYFTDYSATGSGAQATAQFNAAGWEVIQTGWSMVYTYLKIALSFIQANAIGIIIISLLLGLIAFIAYKRRMKKVEAKL